MLIPNKHIRAKHYLEKLNYIPQDATKIEFITHSRAFKERILSLIAQAQYRIYITALYWQKDEAGEEILTALYKAKLAKPTLDICILVDWHRAQRGLIGAEDQSSNADWYTKMRQQYALPHNNDIPFYGVPINGRELFGVLHLKGFVFDDTLLYSGASINNVYLQQFERYRYDRYHQIHNSQLTDSFVQLIQQQILSDKAVFRLDTDVRPKTNTIRPLIKSFRKKLSLQHYLFSGQALTHELGITPLLGLGRTHNQLNKTIEALFYQVQEKLTICTPYFNFPRSLRKSIEWLLNNGKQVEIIVGDKTANDFYTKPDENFTLASALPYLYEKNLRSFSKQFEYYLSSGRLIIRLWKHDDNSYHLKGVWIDHRYILLTGNNLNPRAWRLDAENAVLISDPKQELKAQVEQELSQIRTHTTLLTHYNDLETVKYYPQKVQDLLKKFGRVKLDKIVKMLL